MSHLSVTQLYTSEPSDDLKKKVQNTQNQFHKSVSLRDGVAEITQYPPSAEASAPPTKDDMVLSWKLNVAIVSGKFQFNVKVLETPGVCLVGWCTAATKPLSGTVFSLGTSEGSYLYDMSAGVTWNNGCNPQKRSDPASVGDEFYCCIDTNQKSISFYKNGKLVVIMNPLSNTALANEEGPFFPCLALFKGKVEVNVLPANLEDEFQSVGEGQEGNDIKFVSFSPSDEPETGTYAHTSAMVHVVRESYLKHFEGAKKWEDIKHLAEPLNSIFLDEMKIHIAEEERKNPEDLPELFYSGFYREFVVILIVEGLESLLRELDEKWQQKVETTCKARGKRPTPLMKVRPVKEGARRTERAIRALAWEYFHHTAEDQPAILTINQMFLKSLFEALDEDLKHTPEEHFGDYIDLLGPLLLFDLTEDYLSRNLEDSYEVLDVPPEARKLEDYFSQFQSSKQYDPAAEDPRTQKDIWEFYITYSIVELSVAPLPELRDRAIEALGQVLGKPVDIKGTPTRKAITEGQKPTNKQTQKQPVEDPSTSYLPLLLAGMAAAGVAALFLWKNPVKPN